MFKKVYLILVHKNPNQVSTLIDLLDDGTSLFFLHVDKNAADFKIKTTKKIVYSINNNVKCKWGTFSLVQATLNALDEIVAFMNVNYHDTNYHVITLSGEDLPIKKNQFINNFLSKKTDFSIVHHWQLPYKNWWGGGFFRFNSVFLFNFLKHRKAHFYLNSALRFFGLSFLMPMNQINKNFNNVKIFGSSQWMILSKKLILDILDKHYENPQLKRAFKYSFAPDETYIATLILNLCDQNHKIINIPTHLLNFNGCDENPNYLSIIAIQNCKDEDILFARKFDYSKNLESINYIKNNLL